MAKKIEQFSRCDNHQYRFKQLIQLFKALQFRKVKLSTELKTGIKKHYQDIQCGSNRYENDFCTVNEKNSHAYRIATEEEIRNSLGRLVC